MKLIQLGGNRYKNKGIRGYAMVDDEDYENLSKYSWFISTSGYPVRSRWHEKRRGGNYPMTRAIIQCPEGKYIDHIDGNRLNNQKSNLRIVDKAQNAWNRGPQRNNKTGYCGVHYESWSQKYRAEIIARGRKYRLGRFASPEDAARAYNDMAKRLHGEYARLNVLYLLQ
jgi:hypothetical protein